MTDTPISTEDMARLAQVERKRFDNDIQRGYLPLIEGPGRGNSRSFSVRDAVHVLTFYMLRDGLELSAGVAGAFARLLANENWRVEGGPNLYALRYREGLPSVERVTVREDGRLYSAPSAPLKATIEDYVFGESRAAAVIIIDLDTIDRSFHARLAALRGQAQGR